MRGEVFALRRPPDALGHEQAGQRYAVVVLATRYLQLSRWLVVPTSTRASAAAFRPAVYVAGGSTRALCDALVAIDPEARLGASIDYLSHDSMTEIDEALALLLDLDSVR